MFYDVPAKQAETEIVVASRNSEHVEKIINRLTAAGFQTRRLKDTTGGTN